MRPPGKALVALALGVNLALYLALSRPLTPVPGPSAMIAPTSGAVLPGDPNEMLQAPIEQIGRQVNGDIPLGGPVPTRDPRSWILVDPGFLTGALAEMDSRPPTTLTSAQVEGCLAFIDAYSSVCERVNSSERDFDQTFSHLLTPGQTKVLSEQRAVVERLPVDLLGLVASTRTLSLQARPGTPQTAPASPQQSHRRSAGTVRWPPTAFFVACLAFLETSQVPLSPEQAATIMPALDALSRDFEERATLYPRLVALLSDAQCQELVRILADIYGGKLDPGVIHQRPQQAALYLRGDTAPRGNVISPGASPSPPHRGSPWAPGARDSDRWSRP